MLHDEYLANSIEGITTSQSMIEIVYPKIYENCTRIFGTSRSDEFIHKYYIESLLSAWSFIDSFNRIRELIKAFPCINKNDTDLVTFLEKTKQVKDFRNHHQHLSRESNNPHNFSNPIWGNLSWVNPENPYECIIILSNYNSNNKHYNGIVYDTFEHKWVSNCSLSLGNQDIPFDVYFSTLKVYLEKFYAWLLTLPNVSSLEKLCLTPLRIRLQ